MKKVTFLALMLAVSAALLATGNEARVYNRVHGGYVVVSESGELLGYSENGTYGAVADAVNDLMAISGRTARLVPGYAPASIEQLLATTALDSVGPLLGDIKFDQGTPYNDMVPEYYDKDAKAMKRCPAGCMAIAMTQIMVYHQHPKVCHGSKISYQVEESGANIEVDIEGYRPDWDNILHDYRGSYTTEQAKAVATLVYYCGASVGMQYGPDGSGSNSEKVMAALSGRFGYNTPSSMLEKGTNTDFDYFKALKAEIDAKMPVYYSSSSPAGSGHAYVLDGYKYDAAVTDSRSAKKAYFHFNFGWGGRGDGWYRLSELKPTESDEQMYDLNANQAAIFISPKTSTALPSLQTTMTESTVYDVLGHKVDVLIPGQLYIRGGRKFIAR